jgi:hypothetical protein
MESLALAFMQPLASTLSPSVTFVWGLERLEGESHVFVSGGYCFSFSFRGC